MCKVLQILLHCILWRLVDDLDDHNLGTSTTVSVKLLTPSETSELAGLHLLKHAVVLCILCSITIAHNMRWLSGNKNSTCFELDVHSCSQNLRKASAKELRICVWSFGGLC